MSLFNVTAGGNSYALECGTPTEGSPVHCPAAQNEFRPLLGQARNAKAVGEVYFPPPQLEVQVVEEIKKQARQLAALCVLFTVRAKEDNSLADRCSQVMASKQAKSPLLGMVTAKLPEKIKNDATLISSLKAELPSLLDKNALLDLDNKRARWLRLLQAKAESLAPKYPKVEELKKARQRAALNLALGAELSPKDESRLKMTEQAAIGDLNIAYSKQINRPFEETTEGEQEILKLLMTTERFKKRVRGESHLAGSAAQVGQFNGTDYAQMASEAMDKIQKSLKGLEDLIKPKPPSNTPPNDAVNLIAGHSAFSPGVKKALLCALPQRMIERLEAPKSETFMSSIPLPEGVEFKQRLIQHALPHDEERKKFLADHPEYLSLIAGGKYNAAHWYLGAQIEHTEEQLAAAQSNRKAKDIKVLTAKLETQKKMARTAELEVRNEMNQCTQAAHQEGKFQVNPDRGATESFWIDCGHFRVLFKPRGKPSPGAPPENYKAEAFVSELSEAVGLNKVPFAQNLHLNRIGEGSVQLGLPSASTQIDFDKEATKQDKKVKRSIELAVFDAVLAANWDRTHNAGNLMLHKGGEGAIDNAQALTGLGITEFTNQLGKNAIAEIIPKDVKQQEKIIRMLEKGLVFYRSKMTTNGEFHHDPYLNQCMPELRVKAIELALSLYKAPLAEFKERAKEVSLAYRLLYEGEGKYRDCNEEGAQLKK